MFQSRRSLKLQKKPRKSSWFFLVVLFLILLPIVGYVVAYRFYFKPVVISPLSTKVFRFDSTDPTRVLQDELRGEHIAFNSVTVATDSAYIATLANGEQILFSKEKNLHEQVASLQLVLSRLTIEGKTIRRLDLRFDKPVIELK